MAQRRKRIKHTATLEERLEKEAIKSKEAAEKQPPAALPENCCCGEPGRPRWPST